MCDIFLSSDTRLVRFLANGAQITRATREIIWTVNLQFVLRERGREGGRGNGGTEEPRSLAPHLAKSDLFNPSLDFPMQASPFPSAPSPLAPLANCFTALFNHLLRRERLALNFRAFLFRETREHHPRAPPRPPLCHPSVVIVVAKSVCSSRDRNVLSTCGRCRDVAIKRPRFRSSCSIQVSRLSSPYRLSRNYFSKVQSSRPTPDTGNRQLLSIRRRRALPMTRFHS